MPTTSNARIANAGLICEAHEPMDKIIERLLAMADEVATADQHTALFPAAPNTVSSVTTQDLMAWTTTSIDRLANLVTHYRVGARIHFTNSADGLFGP